MRARVELFPFLRLWTACLFLPSLFPPRAPKTQSSIEGSGSDLTGQIMCSLVEPAMLVPTKQPKQKTTQSVAEGEGVVPTKQPEQRTIQSVAEGEGVKLQGLVSVGRYNVLPAIVMRKLAEHETVVGLETQGKEAVSKLAREVDQLIATRNTVAAAAAAGDRAGDGGDETAARADGDETAARADGDRAGDGGDETVAGVKTSSAGTCSCPPLVNVVDSDLFSVLAAGSFAPPLFFLSLMVAPPAAPSFVPSFVRRLVGRHGTASQRVR